MSDCSRTPFPGGRHCCCLIKVELFHRQSEVCEGASERPDERTDSSREKLLPFFIFFFGSSVQDPHAFVPHRHLVSHYSQNPFLAECQWRVSSSPPSFLLSVMFANLTRASSLSLISFHVFNFLSFLIKLLLLFFPHAPTLSVLAFFPFSVCLSLPIPSIHSPSIQTTLITSFENRPMLRSNLRSTTSKVKFS